MRTLRESIEIYKGRKAPEVLDEHESGALRYLQIEDLRPNPNFKFARDPDGVIANENDVIIAWDGANAGTVGFGLQGYIGSTLAILRPDPQEVFAPYLGYFLQSKFDYIRGNTTGATIPHVNRDTLENLRVEIPPLPEQQRIAARLDRADRLRRTRRYAQQLSDSFLQAVFVEMFGEFPENSMNWEEMQLEDVVQPDRGVTYGIVQAGPHIPDGVPYIKTGDIADGEIQTQNLSRTSRDIAQSYKRSEVKFGDIVFSIRATVGTCAILPRELDGANLTQGTARIAPSEKVVIHYLLWLLRSKGMQYWFQQQVKGSTFFEITLSRLREAPIMVPPVPLQQKFARIVQQFERLRAQQREHERQAEHLFQTLLQRAFAAQT